MSSMLFPLRILSHLNIPTPGGVSYGLAVPLSNVFLPYPHTQLFWTGRAQQPKATAPPNAAACTKGKGLSRPSAWTPCSQSYLISSPALHLCRQSPKAKGDSPAQSDTDARACPAALQTCKDTSAGAPHPLRSRCSSLCSPRAW